MDLFVPIRVDAIIINSTRQGLPAEINFESLPYFDKKLNIDVNGESPYLGETLAYNAFQDYATTMNFGVHLKWEMPQFLRSTKIGASKPTEFPAVPTRWLICRYRNSVAEKKWIVESDAVLKDFSSGTLSSMVQTSVDVDINSGDRPYAYVGRVQEFTAWANQSLNANPDVCSWKDIHNGKPLTAMGWGSPAFDVFYPNCQSVFGFYDADILQADPDIQYIVTGWYNDVTDDYWKFYCENKIAKIDFDKLMALEHLTEAQKKNYKAAHINKILKDDLSITIDSADSILESDFIPGIMVCYGTFKLQSELPVVNYKHRVEPKFSIGNTPIEAMTAMILGDQKGLSITGRQQFEDQLEAILMSVKLDKQKIDVGPKFRETRHLNEFNAIDSGVTWNLRKANNKEPLQDKNVDKGSDVPLSKEATYLLTSLNNSQRIYNTKMQKLESYKAELYADWYRYMYCAYPPEGELEEYLDVSEVREMIRLGSLRKFTRGKSKFGVPLNYTDEDMSSFKNEIPLTWADKVRHAWLKLTAYLKHVINKDPSEDNFHWELNHSAAPRFWEPTPPAVLIAFPSETQEWENEEKINTLLNCNLRWNKKGNESAFDVPWALNEVATLLPEPSNQGINYYSQKRNIFRVEWEVEIFPVASMYSGSRSSGTYNPDFIEHNYLLGENEPDLQDSPLLASNLSLMKTASVYTGSTFVNTKLAQRYKQLLADFDSDQNNYMPSATNFKKTVNDALEFLNTHQVIAVTLSGFNSALLQMHQSIQLKPADPLGFDDFKAFADEVAQALDMFKGFSPDPNSDFMPIRAGAMRLLTLRLVDSFGYYEDFEPDTINAVLSMQMPGRKDWIRLPPRLSQPARFNFRFLQSEMRKAVDAQTQVQSTPVYGWIVPNLLDNSLVLFDASGKLFGEVFQRNFWLPAGNIDISNNPLLWKVKKWLMNEKANDAEMNDNKDDANFASGENNLDTIEYEKDERENFIGYFIEDLEEALDNIHPLDRSGQGAFSVLMGRPMALVRIGVELEILGNPAFNLNWSEFRIDVNRKGRESERFENVKFPFRVGEHQQHNDGLVGYWSFSYEGELGNDFNLNDTTSAAVAIPAEAELDMPPFMHESNEEWKLLAGGETLLNHLRSKVIVKKQDLIQVYIRGGSRVWDTLVEWGWLIPEKPHKRIQHYGESGLHSLSIADKMQQFICLLDPFGLVHLTSGIQPVKTIQLPETLVKDALQKMEVSFFSAPVLGAHSNVEISLSQNEGFAWSWVQNHPSGKLILEEDKIQPFKLMANFPERVVARDGKLLISQKTNIKSDN